MPERNINSASVSYTLCRLKAWLKIMKSIIGSNIKAKNGFGSKKAHYKPCVLIGLLYPVSRLLKHYRILTVKILNRKPLGIIIIGRMKLLHLLIQHPLSKSASLMPKACTAPSKISYGYIIAKTPGKLIKITVVKSVKSVNVYTFTVKGKAVSYKGYSFFIKAFKYRHRSLILFYFIGKTKACRVGNGK